MFLAAALAAALPVPLYAAATPIAPAARAEVQIALCAPPADVVSALRLRARDPAVQVWLFDDARLSLFDRGVRIRLRASADGSELTVKVGNQDCARVDAATLSASDGKCEYDVHGTAVAGAVSLSQDLDSRRTADLVAGRVGLADVLNTTQRNFLRDAAGVSPLPAGLKGLGPTQLMTYETKKHRYDVDVSKTPDGAQYVEISRKVPVKDVASVSDRMKADMTKAGVAMCSDQSGQARTKLLSMVR